MTMNTVAIGVGLFVGSCDVIGPPAGSSDVLEFVIEFVVGLEVGLEVGSNVCEDIGFPSPGPVGNRNCFNIQNRVHSKCNCSDDDCALF